MAKNLTDDELRVQERLSRLTNLLKTDLETEVDLQQCLLSRKEELVKVLVKEALSHFSISDVMIGLRMTKPDER